MNLILLTDSDRTGEKCFELRDHRAEHIRTVLKAAAGDTVEVGLIDGPRGQGMVEELSDKHVRLRVDDWIEAASITPNVDLIVALPRPQTLKKVLLTAAMMGARRLDLIRANRVERSYYQSPLLEPENYRPFLLEGLSQGKLTRLPQVAIHQRFRPFFEDTLPLRDQAEPGMLKLVPDPDAAPSLYDVLPGAMPVALQIAIGPEGGWVPFELERMQSLGFTSITLGRWILRVEHAVTATLSQLELLRLRTD